MHFSLIKATTKYHMWLSIVNKPQEPIQSRHISIRTTKYKWFMRFSKFTKSHKPLQKFSFQTGIQQDLVGHCLMGH